MNAARLRALEVLASVAARQRQPSMSPDGLGDWQARRHGTAPPNVPRKLTKIFVAFSSTRNPTVMGDNGTTLVNVSDELAAHVEALRHALED